MGKIVPANRDKKNKPVNFESVKHRKGVFIFRLSRYWRGNTKGKFQDNMDDQKLKTMVFGVIFSHDENNFIILKYILKQKQIPRKLLVLFGNARGAFVK